MNIKNAKRLIAVLESGKYKQAFGKLQASDSNRVMNIDAYGNEILKIISTDGIVPGGEFHCCIHVAACEFGSEMTDPINCDTDNSLNPIYRKVIAVLKEAAGVT